MFLRKKFKLLLRTVEENVRQILLYKCRVIFNKNSPIWIYDATARNGKVTTVCPVRYVYPCSHTEICIRSFSSLPEYSHDVIESVPKFTIHSVFQLGFRVWVESIHCNNFTIIQWYGRFFSRLISLLCVRLATTLNFPLTLQVVQVSPTEKRRLCFIDYRYHLKSQN